MADEDITGTENDELFLAELNVRTKAIVPMVIGLGALVVALLLLAGLGNRLLQMLP